jgi:hypothetical protein
MSLNYNTELALINTTTNSGTITLPSAITVPGRVISFKDSAGNFNNKSVTLICGGSDTFEDGTTQKVFYESFGSIQVIASGTKWYILSGVKQNAMTISSLITSTISTYSISFSDGSFQTISADKSINSSIVGLGTFGYISTSQLVSTAIGLVDHLELNSSVIGLGSIGYLSSFNSISSLNVSTGNLFANIFTTTSISTNLISSGSLITSFINANSYNGLTIGGNINMNGGVFPTSGNSKDLGASGAFRWNNFWVSTISSIHTTTSTLLVQNTITASTLNVGAATGSNLSFFNISTNNITGFNLLGTTILSTQAIFCSSLQIGPADAILDILGPLRTQDMSTLTCQTSSIVANTMTTNRLFGGPLTANTTTTQNLNPFTVGAQIGLGSNTAQLGFYSEGHFVSTFTRVIQPTLDNDGFSNVVFMRGNVSSQNINVSSIFGTLISTNTTITSNLFGPTGGSAVNCGNLYPTGVNILGFGTGGPGNGPWDSASIRQTQTSSIITNSISTGSVFSARFTQNVITNAVAPSGVVSLNLTSGNVFYFTSAMATSNTANFTTANATVGSTYYVNFLTGATPGTVTFTGNTGATTLSITGLSLVGNPSVPIGLHGAGQSFTPNATTRYMFTCIAIAP